MKRRRKKGFRNSSLGHAVKNMKRGALHRELGVPEGEKIPEKKLEAAAHKPGKLGRRARFAETLRGFKHKGRKRGRRMS